MRQFIREAIEGTDFDRQQAIYGPFTDAVRDLLDAAIRTEVDDVDVIGEAQRAIEAVTARLRTKQKDGPLEGACTVVLARWCSITSSVKWRARA
jgi:hypothetical protein